MYLTKLGDLLPRQKSKVEAGVVGGASPSSPLLNSHLAQNGCDICDQRVKNPPCSRYAADDLESAWKAQLKDAKNIPDDEITVQNFHMQNIQNLRYVPIPLNTPGTNKNHEFAKFKWLTCSIFWQPRLKIIPERTYLPYTYRNTSKMKAQNEGSIWDQHASNASGQRFWDFRAEKYETYRNVGSAQTLIHIIAKEGGCLLLLRNLHLQFNLEFRFFNCQMRPLFP